GPLGTLTAGRMRISQDDETAAYLLVFKDGVKLIYTPNN
ncbi:MAG: lipopolysaccharide export system protein LptC, partial [Halocynthiibacter sp.]